ncbi:putative dna-directed rna polymerase 3 subunit [Diaporthe ampelina]|uniref:DNA-directed RNA polymerase III subunit n=1 Tax=Diaporthe ampelina TaxID=1214573 RepID=A0A0G2FHS5_9PEZI|nr:putative dna-directed rna polymerase 3 subunit [Diaporthe ampelina]
MPWQEDPTLRPYDVPIPAPLVVREKSQVKSYLLFREQVHDGPFYTATRSRDPSAAARAYGQEQVNQRYGLKSKATLDPFTAVEMPSSRMRRPERALPDFSERPFNKSLFPPELHATLDGDDEPQTATGRRPGKKKKTMTLSKVTSLRTAEEIFNMPTEPAAAADGSGPADHQKALEALDQLGEGGGEGDDDIDLGLDDEDGYGEEMDDAYDDDDGGDYDAEGYFDNGDDDDMDDGGGDEGEY